MQLMKAFDATLVNPTQSTGQLPVGKHPVVAIASDIKTNNAGDGGYLQFELQIIDGPSKGLTGVKRFNLYSKTPKAVEIANNEFSAMCHVCNTFQINDSAQLHNIPFVVEVVLQNTDEAREKGYTEVKRMFDINGNEPGRAGAGAPAAQPQQQQQAAQQQQASQPAAAGWGQPQQQQATAPAATGWGGQQGQQTAAPANAPWGQPQ